MYIIAHRGNLNGINQKCENDPSYLQKAIDLNFFVETDIWHINNKFFLGHDKPDYGCDFRWFIDRIDKLWIHCKNIEALNYFHSNFVFYTFNYFWHQEDDYTITSQGHIWAYPGKLLNKECVMVMPEWDDPTFEKIKEVECLAICSDYVSKLKDIIPNVQSR